MIDSSSSVSHNLIQDDGQEEDQWAFGRDLSTSLFEVPNQRRLDANRETNEIKSPKCPQENVYVQPAQKFRHILTGNSSEDRRHTFSFRISIPRTRSLKIHKHQHTWPCVPLHIRLEAHMYRPRPTTITKIGAILSSYYSFNTRQICPLCDTETKRIPAGFE